MPTPAPHVAAEAQRLLSLIPGASQVTAEPRPAPGGINWVLRILDANGNELATATVFERVV